MSDLTSLLANTPGGLVSSIAGKLIDTVASFFPNPEQKAAAAQAVAMAQLNGAFKEEEYQFQLMLEQIKTNEVEAGSPNWFVAGWRPYIGWVCGTGLAYEFLLMPLGNGISVALDHPAIFITLNTDTLLSCLSGLLGLGAMRSFEKFKGVEANR